MYINKKHNDINFVEITRGEPRNAIFLFHGYGSNNEDMISLIPSLQADNVVFIVPNGIKPAERNEFLHMEDESNRQWFGLRDINDLKYISTELRQSGDIVANFIESQLERLQLSHNKVILSGFSQGAILSCHLGATLQQKVGGVISCSGGLFSFAMIGMKISDPHYTFIHGHKDNVLPIFWSQSSVDFLTRRNNTPDKFFFEDLGHYIDNRVIDVINLSLKKYLGNT